MRFRTLRLLPVLMVAASPYSAILDRAARPAAAAEPAEEAAAKNNYEELQSDENLRRNHYHAVNGMLMAGRFAADQQPIFDNYYQKYFLARWTEARFRTNLPKFRQELGNQLRKKSAGTEVHDHLNALVLEFMKKLAAGPYHPAVQVNAMLMIGELNSVEQPPTPLPEALDALIAAVRDAKLSDAVRVAALVGIERHVAAGISDADLRRGLTATLLKVAAGDLSSGAGRAGREWILANAIEILGRLGSVGEGNAIFKLMADAVADSKLWLSTRSVAAESLGRLNYAGAGGINAVEAAAALARFLLDACDQESPKARETDPASGQRLQRRLQQCSAAATTALEKLASAAPPGQQAVLGELHKHIEKLIEQLGASPEGEELEAAVSELQGGLRAWLKKQSK